MTDKIDKTAGHTPGPWTAIGGGLSIGVYTNFNGDTPIGDPKHIASCWHNTRVPRVDGYANARLIAAAPETAAERDRLLEQAEELDGARIVNENAMNIQRERAEAAETRVADFQNAARELQRYGPPGEIGCWCNTGDPIHSPGCLAMRAALKQARP